MGKIFRVEIETGISGFTCDLNQEVLLVHPLDTEDKIHKQFEKEGFTPSLVIAKRYYRLVFSTDLVDELIDELYQECSHSNSSYPDSGGDIHCLDCGEILGNVHPDNY